MSTYAFQFEPLECRGNGAGRVCERRGKLAELQLRCTSDWDGYSCIMVDSSYPTNYTEYRGCIAPLETQTPGCGPTQFWCPDPSWAAAPLAPYGPSYTALAPRTPFWQWMSIDAQGSLR